MQQFISCQRQFCHICFNISEWETKVQYSACCNLRCKITTIKYRNSLSRGNIFKSRLVFQNYNRTLPNFKMSHDKRSHFLNHFCPPFYKIDLRDSIGRRSGSRFYRKGESQSLHILPTFFTKLTEFSNKRRDLVPTS